MGCCCCCCPDDGLFYEFERGEEENESAPLAGSHGSKRAGASHLKVKPDQYCLADCRPEDLAYLLSAQRLTSPTRRPENGDLSFESRVETQDRLSGGRPLLGRKLTVEDFMVPAKDVVQCAPDTSIREVMAKLVLCKVGSILVVSGANRPFSIVTASDCVLSVVLKGVGLDRPVREIMSPRPLVTVGIDTDRETLVGLLHQHQVAHLVVIASSAGARRDGQGQVMNGASGELLGVVSSYDIVCVDAALYKECLLSLADKPITPTTLTSADIASETSTRSTSLEMDVCCPNLMHLVHTMIADCGLVSEQILKPSPPSAVSSNSPSAIAAPPVTSSSSSSEPPRVADPILAVSDRLIASVLNQNLEGMKEEVPTEPQIAVSSNFSAAKPKPMTFVPDHLRVGAAAAVPRRTLRARDVMLTRNEMVTCCPDTPLLNAVHAMCASRQRAVVVVHRDRAVGIVTTNDVVAKTLEYGCSLNSLPIREVMTSPVVSVQSHASYNQAVHLMRKRRVHHILVTDPVSPTVQGAGDNNEEGMVAMDPRIAQLRRTYGDDARLSRRQPNNYGAVDDPKNEEQRDGVGKSVAAAGKLVGMITSQEIVRVAGSIFQAVLSSTTRDSQPGKVFPDTPPTSSALRAVQIGRSVTVSLTETIHEIPTVDSMSYCYSRTSTQFSC